MLKPPTVGLVGRVFLDLGHRTFEKLTGGAARALCSCCHCVPLMRLIRVAGLVVVTPWFPSHNA